MTKIDIFSGFLGAGKTTLIKKLIKEAYQGEKLVLIENEFGEIGVDGAFMEDAGIEVTEMNSGCICCSLSGDFSTALKMVADQYQPERILIEPSGVGKLSDVVHAVELAGIEDMVINGLTTIADAKKCRVYMKNFGEFYVNQLENSGCIVLSRTAGMSEAKLQQAVELIRGCNKDAVIVTTPWDELDGKQILAAMEHRDTLEAAVEELNKLGAANAHHHHDHGEECTCGCHDHEHHHHDHGEECTCGCHDHEHHHHDHGEECSCGCHDHEHHHHDHGEECTCGCHDHEHHHHDHDEECTCGCHDHEHHHHEHGEECTCGCHDHDHEHHHHDHGDECSCGCHDHDHHHHAADEVFESWGVETAKAYTEEALAAALEELDDCEAYGMVLRAKGVVAGEGCWYQFDYVPGEYELRKCGAGITGRLCVIGSKLNREAIEGLFGMN